MNEIETQARRCAARVPANVGFDPITIIAIITKILPLLISCFNRNDEPHAAEVRREVIEQNNDAPKRLRRRMARRIRGEATESMTREQAAALAEAVIEEVIASDDSTVSGLCAAVGYEENAE